MEKKFTIECQMEERWINHFLSALKHMEWLGDIGSSRTVSIYADGDGDFRAKFTPNIDYAIEEPSREESGNHHYDAG